MGKNFPQITNLKEKPSCFEKTVRLIEKSFHYEGSSSFKVDFVPLMDESNHHNCFILIDEDENVLAHIGAKEKKLTVRGEAFNVTMLGGITVDENHRGQGHFQTLLQDVLAEKRSETALFLLWSDNEKLYNKFGFHLCGNQFEYASEGGENSFVKTKYHSLSAEDQRQIQKLYQDSFAKTYLTFDRNDEDWKLIQKMTSADLYLKRGPSGIESYFFMNKGQDLPGIIYEYGSIMEFTTLIKSLSGQGKVWMGSPSVDTESLQYQFFMSPGDLRLFTAFISKITQGQFQIRNVNLMKQEVFFDFNGETLVLSIEEFLRGVFGPGAFEELENLPNLFISGLDSI